jgi:hypothetical protein
MSAVLANSPGLASLLDTEIDRDRVRLLDRLAPTDPAALYASSQPRPRVDPTTLVGGPEADGPRLWEGRSTLPALDRFQLWFFKDSQGAVYGRTVTMASFFTGPGYFAVLRDESRRADLVLRYDTVPDASEIPRGWPAVVRNDAAPAVVPFGQLEIFLRAARRNTFAGEAFRNGVSLRTNLVLVPGVELPRSPASPSLTTVQHESRKPRQPRQARRSTRKVRVRRK